MTSAAHLATARSSMRGPRPTPGWLPEPICTAEIALVKAATKASAIPAWTRIRLDCERMTAPVAQLGDDRALDSTLEVCVVEDDQRRVSAELHRGAHVLFGALRDEEAAQQPSSQ